MNLEFEGCLKRGKIKEFSQGKSLTQKELRTAESDLKEAKETFQKEGYKWATIPWATRTAQEGSRSKILDSTETKAILPRRENPDIIKDI